MNSKRNRLELKDKWVLVTGASSGLGRQMCIDLAKIYGAKIFAVARRKERLIELENEIRQYSDIRFAVLDITDSEKLHQSFQEITETVQIHAFILNAGVTNIRKDVELPLERKKSMINTNIVGTVEFAHLACQYFVKNGLGGALLFVASMAALIPVPGQALYSGTKSFLYGYASALVEENKEHQFSISICLPGGINTEMIEEQHMNRLKRWLMSVEEASAKTLKGFVKRKSAYTLTASDRLVVMIAPLIPKRLKSKIIGRIYEGLY